MATPIRADRLVMPRPPRLVMILLPLLGIRAGVVKVVGGAASGFVNELYVYFGFFGLDYN
jgi:hypothetical protein